MLARVSETYHLTNDPRSPASYSNRTAHLLGRRQAAEPIENVGGAPAQAASPEPSGRRQSRILRHFANGLRMEPQEQRQLRDGQEASRLGSLVGVFAHAARLSYGEIESKPFSGAPWRTTLQRCAWVNPGDQRARDAPTS